RRRPGPRAVRRLPPRVLRALRGRLRPLRPVHRGHHRPGLAGGGRLPRAPRVRAGRLDRLPGPLRRRAPGPSGPPGAGTDAAVSTSCTPAELLAVMGARQLRDDTTVFAG